MHDGAGSGFDFCMQTDLRGDGCGCHCCAGRSWETSDLLRPCFRRVGELHVPSIMRAAKTGRTCQLLVTGI